MKKQSTIKEYIEGILNTTGYAVLATEGNGQPHASLIAITPYGGFRQLIFATYCNTLKYRNLVNNNKVAVFFENRDENIKGPDESAVLTIIGHTEEIRIADNEAAFQAHLTRHPQMEPFMRSPDCALILVIAQSFQVVYGIDDIRWITAEDLYAI